MPQVEQKVVRVIQPNLEKGTDNNDIIEQKLTALIIEKEALNKELEAYTAHDKSNSESREQRLTSPYSSYKENCRFDSAVFFFAIDFDYVFMYHKSNENN